MSHINKGLTVTLHFNPAMKLVDQNVIDGRDYNKHHKPMPDKKPDADAKYDDVDVKIRWAKSGCIVVAWTQYCW